MNYYGSEIIKYCSTRGYCASEWPTKLNKIGMYHLGGSCWPHFLYTIPEDPFKSLIILDGDKQQKAQKLIGEIQQNNLIRNEFIYCNSLGKVENIWTKEDKYPVYCLQRLCIEKYLPKKLECTNNSNYNKKIDGPKIVHNWKVRNFPKEIKKIIRLVADL